MSDHILVMPLLKSKIILTSPKCESGGLKQDERNFAKRVF